MANKSSTILRVLMHGFFLTSLNLFSGATTFLILHLAGIKTGIEAVGIIALILFIGFYVGVFYLMRRIQPEILKIDSLGMGFFILLFSMMLQPALIHPIMSFVRGAGFNAPTYFSELIIPAIMNVGSLVLNRFFLNRD